jgi:hypothetical protein
LKRESNRKGVGKNCLAVFPVVEVLEPQGFRERPPRAGRDVRFSLPQLEVLSKKNSMFVLFSYKTKIRPACRQAGVGGIHYSEHTSSESIDLYPLRLL